MSDQIKNVPSDANGLPLAPDGSAPAVDPRNNVGGFRRGTLVQPTNPTTSDFAKQCIEDNKRTIRDGGQSLNNATRKRAR